MNNLLSHVRAHCVTDWRILVLFSAFSLWIAYSYLRIPFTLRRILRRVGGQVTGGGEVKGFARFITSCGITHIFAVAVLFFVGLDWFSVTWLGWTGYISWRTERLVRDREEVLVQAILEAHHLEVRVSQNLGTPPQDLVPNR
jgi:hypothetical protein